MANYLAALSIFDVGKIVRFKDQFREQFKDMCAKEREYCKKVKAQVQMTPEKYKEVEDLLAKCYTPYHVESLRRIVLVECVIPSWEELDKIANELIVESTV